MHARPLDAFAATLVFALCVVWGFNQVVVKLALPDVGPIAQTGIRSGIAALCVIAYAVATKRRIFEIDGTEAAGALAGALFTAEFIALYESLRFTTAARATVFIYAAPFFVAVGAASSVVALLWQGVVVAGVSYALWLWTLTRYAVAELSAFIFITPLVGVLAGWLVFGETLSWGFSLAIVLVIAGLALVNWPRRIA